MKNSISLKDLSKIQKKSGNKKLDEINSKKPKRTYYDRINDAINYGFSFKKDFIEEFENHIIFNFEDTVLISHNDLLRINFKTSYKYIKLWKDRVKNIAKDVKNKDIFKNKSVILEFYIEVNKENLKLDYDSILAATKFITDGIVQSKLLVDDNLNHIPLMIAKAKKIESYYNCVRVLIRESDQEQIDALFTIKD